MKEYISKEELARCMKVKNIFAELSERNGDFCVVDAYPFGCEVLEWFNEDGLTDQSISQIHMNYLIIFFLLGKRSISMR